MNAPWKKRKSYHTWEFEPYAFEPGRIYVMEVNLDAIETQQLQGLNDFFLGNGINIKLVPTKGRYRALQPIEVKRMTEINDVG